MPNFLLIEAFHRTLKISREDTVLRFSNHGQPSSFMSCRPVRYEGNIALVTYDACFCVCGTADESTQYTEQMGGYEYNAT